MIGVAKRLLLVGVPAILAVLLGCIAGWHAVIMGGMAALITVVIATPVANVASRSHATAGTIAIALASALAIRIACLAGVIILSHGRPHGRIIIGTAAACILIGICIEHMRGALGLDASPAPASRESGSLSHA